MRQTTIVLAGIAMAALTAVPGCAYFRGGRRRPMSPYFAKLQTNRVESNPLVLWQHLGPGMSGYVEHLWINNGDPNAMYNTLDMGNGHVTLNRGDFWTSYRDSDGTGKEMAGITGMAFSHQDPDFGIAIGKNMTWRTTDRGRSWSALVDTHPEPGDSRMHSVIAVDPSNDSNWYIGAGQSWNIKGNHHTKNGIVNRGNWSSGFVMVSRDRGQSWAEVSVPFPADASFSSIIVDPRDPNIVYAACQHGVYRSTDGGANWGKVPGKGLPYNQPRDMDSYYNADTGEFLLTIVEITHYDIVGKDIVTTGGVYRSGDGGDTWDNLTGDLAIDLTQVTSWLYRDKFRRAVLWWQEMDQSIKHDEFFARYNLPARTFSQFHELAVDPTDKDRIYLVHNFKHDYSFPPGNIWMTGNGGRTWYAAAREGPYWIEEQDKAYWRSRAIQPPGMNATLAHVDHEHRAFDNTQSGPRFVKCNRLGEVYTCFAQQMMRSTDHGRTWVQIDDDETGPGSGHWVGRGNSNLPGETLCVDTRTPGTYLFGSGEHGLWRNTNDGDLVYPGAIAVEQLTGQSKERYDTLSVSAIAVHPHDTNKIYTLQFRQGNRGALRYSADNGKTWETLSTPVEFPKGSSEIIRQHSLLINHENPDNIYFCVPFTEWRSFAPGQWLRNGPTFDGHGIYKSTDGGKTWRMAMAGIPAGKSVFYMALDPADPRTIYAALNETHTGAAGGLYRTTTSGADWNAVPIPSGIRSVNDIVIHKATGDLLIACGSAKGGGADGGAYISRDGGSSWTLMFDMPYVKNFDACQANADVMVVNVGQDAEIGNLNPGCYVTIDGGTAWHKINRRHGQPGRVRGLRTDPHDENIIWSCFNGTGFFRADISPLRTGIPKPFYWDDITRERR